MDDDPELTETAAALLASQRTYYDLRAPDYGDPSNPDRRVAGLLAPELVEEALDRIEPTGAVLELACGTGAFTGALVRRATSLTALDASSQMLARNRDAVGDPGVRYVEADVFGWRPDRRFDLVFFGCWLSHVPPGAFDRFWAGLAPGLAPGGRVAFVDEDDRAAEGPDLEVVDGVSTARRRLRDGRSFAVVKELWSPDALRRRLAEAGWDVDVRRLGRSYLTGVGRPAHA